MAKVIDGGACRCYTVEVVAFIIGIPYTKLDWTDVQIKNIVSVHSYRLAAGPLADANDLHEGF